MAAEVAWNGASECPPLETVAAFVDGRLSGGERDRIAAHVASCESCYFVFTESAQMEPFQGSTPIAASEPSWWRRPAVKWSGAVAGLAAAAALAIAVTGTLSRDDAPQLTALVAAVGTDRTIEPRLTGGFAHGPLRGSTRAAENAAANVSPDVRIAVALIEKEAIVRRTPRTLQALGMAYLVTGDVQRAVPVLEEAADGSGTTASILSDLSAAYLVRGTGAGLPQDLAKALATADRALQQDATLAPALFNRALALQKLSLATEAQRAWKEYLQVDSTSAWADEARSHLQLLDATSSVGGMGEDKRRIQAAARQRDENELRKQVERSPDATREWLHDQLVSKWTAAIRSAQAGAAAAVLDESQPAAEALAALTGDRFHAEAVASLRRASANAADAERRALALEAFAAAQIDYNRDRIRESMPQFERTLTLLAGTDTGFAAWSRNYLAIGRYLAGDFASAQHLLRLVVADAEAKSYVRVNGLALRLRGLIFGVQADFPRALEDYRASLRAFEVVRDGPNRAAVHALLAEMLDFLGESDQAWAERAHSLTQLPAVEDRRQRHQILLQASLASLRQGLPQAAGYFQRAALDNAIRWGQPLAIFDGHLYQAEIERQLSRSVNAVNELREAQRALANVSDSALVARNQAQIKLAEGELLATSAPGDAKVALTEALSFFRDSQRKWPMARLLLARARAHRAEGRDDLAEADLNEGIEFFEAQRAAVADEALRSASFEQPWDLYSEMIHLQAVTRRQPARALAFAERARARTLLESLSGESFGKAVDPGAVRHQLPPSMTVLYYVTLRDRLLLWTLTAEDESFVDIPLRGSELQHLLRQYRAEMAGAMAGPRDTPSLSRLYDLLIRPAAERIRPGTHVLIVPDGVLHIVPFAALLKKEERRYFVENHPLQIAPSLTVFLLSSARRGTFDASSTALVVGNPEVPSGGALPSLLEAEAEARQVASFYPRAQLLTGPAASKEAFLRAAGEHAIVHFAGHAVANDNHPHLSRLLFAGVDESSRTVLARDVAAQRFASTRLVVLAACRTNTGRLRRGEGVFSLARPFLAAGVPTVIASLWDVNDRASRRLLVKFHEALRGGAAPAIALRTAQLALMGESDRLFHSPDGWAGFTVIGA